jgi:sulfur-carrier protein
VREALLELCKRYPALRSYLFDDQGAVRKHVSIFLDGTPVADRSQQSDPLRPESEIFVLQALSGG